VHKQRRIFQYMPKFSAGDAAHGGVGSHANGISIDAMTSKIAIKRPTGTNGCQPQAKAKGANGKVSEVNEGVHARVCFYSIAGLFSTKP
jgi:hypothetical protein